MKSFHLPFAFEKHPTKCHNKRKLFCSVYIVANQALQARLAKKKQTTHKGKLNGKNLNCVVLPHIVIIEIDGLSMEAFLEHPSM